MKLGKLFILCLLITSCNSKTESLSLKVMTYNIRLDTASDGENAWPNRKGFLTSQILPYFFEIFQNVLCLEEYPNLIGLQVNNH